MISNKQHSQMEKFAHWNKQYVQMYTHRSERNYTWKVSALDAFFMNWIVCVLNAAKLLESFESIIQQLHIQSQKC